MTIDDATTVLAVIAAGDQRTIGEADLLFWARVVPDWIELDDALDGIAIYFRRTRDRMMPVDLIHAAKQARARRLGYSLQEGV